MVRLIRKIIVLLRSALPVDVESAVYVDRVDKMLRIWLYNWRNGMRIPENLAEAVRIRLIASLWRDENEDRTC